ncbi:hypothetical protein [Natrialba swarupiae]|uniref:Uncharacterized protein n=1 Tax=Natrialba swarupiae TaxID=2448032 RepID=A0A5D5AQE6_9EURY|nr:hypothetical protein [Natrialba swarupiae]MCW8172577.1 hypothetical protein [Natrialba swarupiae]TYT63125.1 hypothetical protein FYC77_05650 [Natrialba swarupiae]
MHELADVERNLRRSSTEGVEVSASPDGRGGVRIYFDTWAPNEAHRGRLTASVTTAVVESDGWELVTIHDPLERTSDDTRLVQSAITVR